MSRTTVYAAPESGAFIEVAEYANAWGSAAYVWSALAKRHFGDGYLWMSGEEGGRKVWDLAKREPPLSEAEQLTLLSTFDRALIDRPNFLRLAEAFDEFVRLHPPRDRACSLPQQAALLRKLAGPDHGLDFEPYAVGWQQTSVSENLWYVRDEDGDDGHPYRLNEDVGHWFIAAEYE